MFFFLPSSSSFLFQLLLVLLPLTMLEFINKIKNKNKISHHRRVGVTPLNPSSLLLTPFPSFLFPFRFLFLFLFCFLFLFLFLFPFPFSFSFSFSFLFLFLFPFLFPFPFPYPRPQPQYSATPGLRTWVLDVRVLSYVQMWHQMWVLTPNQDS